MASRNSPGKAHREGISLVQLCDMFPTEESARKWFEKIVWPNGRTCPRCGCADTKTASATSPLPYYCRGCQKPFSVKIGTALQKSNLPLRKWVFAIYLEMTNLKGVSSMKLHRDINVSQKGAWFMLHRIREAWSGELGKAFEGSVAIDGSMFGGRRANMSNAKRKELREAGMRQGPQGKTIAIGAKNRETGKVAAKIITSVDGETLRGFVDRVSEPDATVYTDEARGCKGMERDRESVNHSVSEYVREMARVIGIESFWSMLKRGYHGVYHHVSPKHLERYICECAGRHNLREADTLDQMREVVARLVGKRVLYRELTEG